MQTDRPQMRHNIILFGETGVGKSSIINMLRGSEGATISSSALGCTLSSNGYDGSIWDQDYTFWDTVGLNEGEQGNMPDIKAVTALYHLLRKLSTDGGVSLLVFCMRAPRISDAGHKNWVLFREIVCQQQVPAVIAITYLEQEDMDTWWSANELAFSKRYGINPSEDVYRVYSGGEDVHADVGVACITATMGKCKKGKYIYEEEYRESCTKIQRLVFESHLAVPWKVDAVPWFKKVITEIDAGWWCWRRKKKQTKYESGKGVYDIMSRWGIDEDEAMSIARMLEEGSRSGT
ncbi:hypothetical protein NMY22_g15560 [Coprinellus aureogranulatus]|nr:hypothetical protein NMY22_g15560 [Coprinellus aureogranulatus]